MEVNFQNKLLISLRGILMVFLLNSCMLYGGKVLHEYSDPLYQKAVSIYKSNPEESIRIAEYLIKKSSTIEELYSLEVLLADSYFILGDPLQELQHLKSATEYSLELSSDAKIHVHLRKARWYQGMRLFDPSGYYIEQVNMLTNSANLAASSWKELYDRTNFIQENESLITGKNNPVNSIYSYLNEIDTELDKNSSLQKISLIPGVSSFDEVVNAFELSKQLCGTITNKECIERLENIYEASKYFGNAYLSNGIAEQMSSLLIKQGKYERYAEVSKDKIGFGNAISEVEQAALKVAGQVFQQDRMEETHKNISLFKTFFIIALALLLSVIAVVIVLWYRNYYKRKTLLDVTSYFQQNVAQQTVRKSEKTVVKKMVVKRVSVSEETERVLLQKLKRFEASTRFTNKEMSLGLLASQLDTNTKYLSEIINTHYNDNFNMYINKLRINYIINKMRTDENYLNYKISYLAEHSGFSSHSNFATVFKNITGITPNAFIDILKEEIENKQAV